MAGTLNALEEAYPHTFNKTTVYATISDHDSAGKTEPKAILRSLRRMTAQGPGEKICVIFDFTESYWNVRITNRSSRIRFCGIFSALQPAEEKNILFL